MQEQEGSDNAKSAVEKPTYYLDLAPFSVKGSSVAS